MKLFEEYKPEVVVREPEPVDSSSFIKLNLMKSVDRDKDTRDKIQAWLFSFDGAITKAAFSQQMKRLSKDAAVAASQLLKATGRRVIPLPPPEAKPRLEQPLVAQMLEDRFVAIYGRGFKSALKEAVRMLREAGEVYVLQVEELILQFKSYEDKGKAPEMIDKAIESDFLVIVDLEMPIHIEWHIREAIERIGRRREAQGKPIISTWCRFNDVNDFFQAFKIYYVA